MHSSAVYILRYLMALRLYGASNKGWVRKTSYFRAKCANILKTVGEIRQKLLLMTNRKSYVGFRLTPRSMTLDDLKLL